jgi:hypothetical protein
MNSDGNRRKLERNRQRRVHRHAKRAMLFAAQRLRIEGRGMQLMRRMRKPLTMDMHRLHSADDAGKQQCNQRNPALPQGMRGSKRASWSRLLQNPKIKENSLPLKTRLAVKSRRTIGLS